jgi:hypothetical protein
MKNKNIHNKKTLLIKAGLVITALAILGAGALLWYRTTRTNPQPATSNDASKVNLRPATPEEIADSNQHKEDAADKAKEPTEDPSSTPQAVTPLIIDASQEGQAVEVRSFIPGVYQAGGSCIVTFTNGNSTVTKTLSAIQDATTTRCPNLSVPRGEFNKSGSWTVTVSYTSTTHKGVSAATTLQIQ